MCVQDRCVFVHHQGLVDGGQLCPVVGVVFLQASRIDAGECSIWSVEDCRPQGGAARGLGAICVCEIIMVPALNERENGR